MKKTLFATALLLGTNILTISAQTTSINPMVTALWSQGDPFNGDCPYIEGERSLTGCGATAVAQILNYYKRPASGFGHAQYENVDMDFSQHPIEWNKILDNYKNVDNGPETEAIANLMHVVGAAMKMHYKKPSDGSSPYYYASMMWGLQHYLHFSPQSRYRRRRFYSTAEWVELLNKELEANRPVFYRGDHTRPDVKLTGHIFVIDGRDSEGNYHFNFGHAAASQNKFADLNLINQGNGIWPGIYGICYHHQQAMVTDFEPVEGLTENDFDKTSVILETPIVLANSPYSSIIKAEKSVQARFQIRYASYVSGKLQFSIGFYQDGKLRATSNTIRDASPKDGGGALAVDRSFTLPTQLADGNYEMSVISRDDSSSPWVRGWDNAPNSIPVNVKNGLFTFHMPKYHTLDTKLYLEDGIHEVEGGDSGGKTFEFTVCNPSDNNFEDSIRISVTTKGVTKHSYQATSIYDGQRITYRYFISDEKADFNGKYTVEAFYKEANSGQWIALDEYGTGVGRPVNATLFKGIEIWTAEGICLKRLNDTYSERDYSRLLNELPKGIYLIHDKNGIRKYAKRK